VIVQRKVINLKGAKYLGIPPDFDIELGERMVIAHDKIIGFASQRIAKMTEEAFNTELEAVADMLKAARKVLQAEGMSHETTGK